MILRNKKGTIVDVFILMIVLFSLVIVFGVVKTLWDDIKPDLQEKFGAKGDVVLDKADNIFPVLNFLFIFILGGYVVFIVILASKVEMHPAFYIFAIILTAIATIVAANLSNAYGEMAQSSQLGSGFTYFTIPDFVMDNLVLFIVVISFMVIIAMYAKAKMGDSTGQ